MEVKNHKVINNFIDQKDAAQLIKWIEGIEYNGTSSNHHLTELAKELNGVSHIYDVSNTELTNYIAKYQSITENSKDSVPDLIYDLISRISQELGISKDHTFFQAVDMKQGGKINPHYDASVEGYINYKCNLCLLSDDYKFYVGDQNLVVKELDLYCFEASLYKHWTDTFNSRRVFISFGFMVPYKELGRSEEDPRIRLSRRIERYFQRSGDPN